MECKNSLDLTACQAQYNSGQMSWPSKNPKERIAEFWPKWAQYQFSPANTSEVNRTNSAALGA
jgi:hypothetical protein